MKHRTWAAVAVAAIALSGCGSSGSSTPTPTPTPTPSESSAPATPRAAYDSVTQLRDAAIAAGMPCPAWDEDDRVEKAASSGQCSDSDVLSVYLTAQDASDAVQGLKQVGGGLTNLLVGQNWIINDTDPAVLRKLQPKLGGMLIRG